MKIRMIIVHRSEDFIFCVKPINRSGGEGRRGEGRGRGGKRKGKGKVRFRFPEKVMSHYE